MDYDKLTDKELNELVRDYFYEAEDNEEFDFVGDEEFIFCRGVGLIDQIQLLGLYTKEFDSILKTIVFTKKEMTSREFCRAICIASLKIVTFN